MDGPAKALIQRSGARCIMVSLGAYGGPCLKQAGLLLCKSGLPGVVANVLGMICSSTIEAAGRISIHISSYTCIHDKYLHD